MRSAKNGFDLLRHSMFQSQAAQKKNGRRQSATGANRNMRPLARRGETIKKTSRNFEIFPKLPPLKNARNKKSTAPDSPPRETEKSPKKLLTKFRRDRRLATSKLVTIVQ